MIAPKYASLFLIAIALALLSSCTWFTDYSNQVKADTLEGTFLLSHFEATDMNVAYSKAAVPAADIATGISIPTASAVSKSNYPEQGQTSTYTIVSPGLADPLIYLVTVNTTYGGGWVNGVRQSTTESYYIKDQAPTGSYTTTDIIVDATGASSPFSRVSLSTTYITKARKGVPQTTSTRYETIVFGQQSPGYTSFAAAPLVYNWDYVPATTTSGVNWSSEVTYTHELPADALSQNGTVVTASPTFYLEGKRFYTELGSATDHTASSIAFERVYDGPITNGVSSGRLIAQMVTRVSYSRAASLPVAAAQVDTKAWYYVANNVDPPLVVTKSGLASSTPLP